MSTFAVSMRPRTHRSFIRIDAGVVKKKGTNAGWYKGANSTCRRHIASHHYEVYSARCKTAQISEGKEAIPARIRQAREKTRAQKGITTKQTTLDGVVCKVVAPSTFSKTSILDAVARHIVCGNKVSVRVIKRSSKLTRTSRRCW